MNPAPPVTRILAMSRSGPDGPCPASDPAPRRAVSAECEVALSLNARHDGGVDDFDTLVALLRAWLRGQPLPRLPASALTVAEAHRVAGLVYHIRPPMDQPTEARARQIWTTQAGHALRLTRTFAAQWPKTAPPPLVFKGFDIAENVLRDPGARRVSDLDLLLPDPAWAHVHAVWSRSATRVQAPRAERYPGEPAYEAGFAWDDALLELHRHPQPQHRGGPSGFFVYARARPGVLSGLDVLYPSAPDRVVLWLVNQCKGSLSTDLADLVDLALALRALEAETDGSLDALSASVTRFDLEAAWHVCLRRLASTDLVDAPRCPTPTRLERALNALSPELGPVPRTPSPARFQAIKLALTPARLRAGVVARGLRAKSPGRR